MAVHWRMYMENQTMRTYLSIQTFHAKDSTCFLKGMDANSTFGNNAFKLLMNVLKHFTVDLKGPE